MLISGERHRHHLHDRPVRRQKNYKAGDTVTLTVYRNGEYITLDLTFDRRPKTASEDTTTDNNQQDNQQQGSQDFSDMFRDFYNYYFGQSR